MFIVLAIYVFDLSEMNKRSTWTPILTNANSIVKCRHVSKLLFKSYGKSSNQKKYFTLLTVLCANCVSSTPFDNKHSQMNYN